jgi:hypothetical protein
MKLVKECPLLNERERELLVKIDVQGGTLSRLADSLGLSKSTVSLQRKRGLRKLDEWLRRRREQESQANEHSVREFDKECFSLFNRGWDAARVVVKLGNTERVFELWKKYRGLWDDYYLLARERLAESEFELGRSSKHPLYEQVDRIIRERYWLSEEKRARLEGDHRHGIRHIHSWS